MIKFEDYWNIEKKIVIQIMLTTKCNLQCSGCSYGCDLAKPYYISLSDYKKIFNKLNSLMAEYTNKHNKIHFNLLGGEPLLHPQIDKILKYSLSRIPYFNFTSCCITTNGIKLLNLSTKFYKLLQHKYMYLSITKYPIAINYEKIFNFLKANHIAHDIQGKIAYSDWKGAANCIDPIDYTTLKFGQSYLNPEKDKDWDFANCMHLTKLVCWTVYDNKIFPCAVMAGFYIKKVNGIEPYKSYKFVEATSSNNWQGDYIDIDKMESFDNIISCMKYATICRHCFSFGEKTWSSKFFKNVRIV